MATFNRENMCQKEKKNAVFNSRIVLHMYTFLLTIFIEIVLEERLEVFERRIVSGVIIGGRD